MRKTACILALMWLAAFSGCTSERTGLAYPVQSDEWRHQWGSQFYSPLQLAYGYSEEQDSHEFFEKVTQYGPWCVLENRDRAALVRYDKVVWAGTRIVSLRRDGQVCGLVLLKETRESNLPVYESGAMYDGCYFSLQKGPKDRISWLGIVWVPVNPLDWVWDIDNDGSEEILTAEQPDRETNQWRLTLRSTKGIESPLLSDCEYVELPVGVIPRDLVMKHEKNALKVFSDHEEEKPPEFIGEFRKDKGGWKFVKAPTAASQGTTGG